MVLIYSIKRGNVQKFEEKKDIQTRVLKNRGLIAGNRPFTQLLVLFLQRGKKAEDGEILSEGSEEERPKKKKKKRSSSTSDESMDDENESEKKKKKKKTKRRYVNFVLKTMQVI